MLARPILGVKWRLGSYFQLMGVAAVVEREW